MADWCEFKKFLKPEEWRVYEYEIRDGYRPKVQEKETRRVIVRRCPLCNKRLTLKVVTCCDGHCPSHYEIPDHKPRETRKPGPRRKSRASGRGK